MDLSKNFITLFIFTLTFVWKCWSDMGLPDVNYDKSGRIQEFDHFLRINIKDIMDQRNMKRILGEARSMAAKVVLKKEYAKYYVEVLEWIEEEGMEGVSKERERLHIILSTTDEGSGEVRYALKRRDVLEAFLDAAALQVMRDMNLGDGNILPMDLPQRQPGDSEFVFKHEEI